MVVFFLIVFLAGVAAALVGRAWIKGCEDAQKARIAREQANAEVDSPTENQPTRRRKR